MKPRNRNYLQALVALLLLCAVSGCTTVHIDESRMLQSRRQALWYDVALLGPASTAQLVERSGYPERDVTGLLGELQARHYISEAAGQWELGPQYPPEGREYAVAIRGFSEEALAAAHPDHRFSMTRIDGDRLLVAGFTAAHARSTLLVFGGNGFHVVPDVEEAAKLLAPDRNVFVMDYPGMGGSAGETTIADLQLASRAFFDAVGQLPGVRGTRLVLYGFSIGGFVATELAASHRVDGLILDSTAPDIQAWIDANVPLYAKLFVRVEVSPPLRGVSNTRDIAALDCPMLFIAGSDDRVTPPPLVRALYDAAGRARWKRFVELEGAGHGGSSDSPDFAPAIDGFMRRVAGG